MGFYFSPRGGSAQVARYLCRALAGGPWQPVLFAGSSGFAAEGSNARSFFAGIDINALDYSAAKSGWSRGLDPMAAATPLHASYEDKRAVPDRLMIDLDEVAFGRQVASWTRHFAAHTGAAPSVVHLHHLTPMHEAVAALWPHAPLITHLHGTELKMLAAIDDGTIARRRGRFAGAWVKRMQRWAQASDRIVVVSGQDRQLALDLLDVDPKRVATIGNGVDTEVFSPRTRARVQTLAHWRRWLVDDPRGWRPGGGEGSIRYGIEDLAAFTDSAGGAVPVVLFAGRFLGFKRLQLLIEAHHALQMSGAAPSVLVIAGGFPGEWEGEHPHDTVSRLGATGVFFAGWRDHDDLAALLDCSDVFAAPSVDEPFGLVYLEAMAAGVPPIATTTGGPQSFINLDPAAPTGWLVAPDDRAATTRALAAAITDSAGRTERGRRAAQFVRATYSWSTVAASFVALYADVTGESGDASFDQPDRPLSGVA